MPTVTLAQHAEEREKQIAELLHNGREVTNKDICWLIFGMNTDMRAMTSCLTALMCKPPNKLAQTAIETAVKWAVPFGIGFLFWAMAQFVTSGFKLP